MSYQRKKSEWELVELPSGFRTSFGYWYTMTTEGIESYVPGLLKLYSVQHLIRIADDWLQVESNYRSWFSCCLYTAPYQCH